MSVPRGEERHTDGKCPTIEGQFLEVSELIYVYPLLKSCNGRTYTERDSQVQPVTERILLHTYNLSPVVRTSLVLGQVGVSVGFGLRPGYKKKEEEDVGSVCCNTLNRESKENGKKKKK